MKVVIIGNGIAGVEAAIAVRAKDPGARITIVSEESDHLFSRTALLYVLVGQLRHADMEPHERDLYARIGAERVRARALGLDLPGRRVLLAGGLPPLPYDRLLIACGSRPRPAPWPGAELAGVGHFVTLSDLAWLEEELYGGPGRGGQPPRPTEHHDKSGEGSPYLPRPSARAGRGRAPREVAVIGGGLIGIEVIESMLAAGYRPHFVMREAWFWPMAIDAGESAFIAAALREHGVNVHLQREIEALEGQDGRLSGIRLRGGELLPAEIAVVAIGVMPNTAWLRESGLDLDPASGGVRVDETLRSSDEAVFAAGDCAAVPWRDGSRRPEQLWYTARDQGRAVAAALLGEPRPYVRTAWYNSAKLMDIEYTTAGQVELGPAGQGQPELWSFRIEEEGPVRSSTRICCTGERVVGFNLLGRRWDHSVLMSFIDQGRSLPWVLEHLSRARFDTELVPTHRLPADTLARARQEAAAHAAAAHAIAPVAG